MEREELTKCETLIMKVVWDADEELSLTDVQTRVNEKYNKKWKPQTVSTFLSRLVKKNYLKSYRNGRVFFYQILVPIGEYKAYHTDQYVKMWCNNDAADFLSALINERSLRQDEIQRIKDFIIPITA